MKKGEEGGQINIFPAGDDVRLAAGFAFQIHLAFSGRVNLPARKGETIGNRTQARTSSGRQRMKMLI